jgi:nucleotide-binding universal stress UspA family protein
MKTILLLTDFSIKADYAAHYALKLAKKIRANILLCNAFIDSSVDFVSAQTGFPVVPINTPEDNSIDDLKELASRLQVELDKTSALGEFIPEIEQCSMAGPVSDAVNTITASRHIAMAVIGTHSNGLVGAFFQGDHTSEIIEKANCPVLVLPYMVPYHNFKKISFATDLTHSSTDILHSLYSLTKYFDSEIMVTYVMEENSSVSEEQKVIKQFYSQNPASINYPKVHYRTVKSNNVTAGLNWLTEHTDVDLLVLIHRKRSFFQRLFEESVTHKLAAHLAKPMLVFPGSKVYEPIPAI